MANGTNGAVRAPRTLGRQPLSLAELARYNPNRPDATEAIWQPFFDFQSYGTAGATSFTFFQVPQGQSSKTFEDTNMVSAGSFPAPTAFLCMALMVLFIPGGTISASATATTAANNWNDVAKVSNNGYLVMTIGSKPYLTDAPIGKFAPNFTIGGTFGGYGSSTANSLASVDFARAQGRYYEITPFLIPQSQNFSVSLYYPTAQTVNATGRIGVIMDGFYYRQSQ